MRELLGHRDVEMMMISRPVLNRGGRSLQSPLDGLRKAEAREPDYRDAPGGVTRRREEG